MCNKTSLILAVLIFAVSASAVAQSQENDDPLLRVVELSKQTYFNSAEDEPLVLPAGNYWVEAVDGSIKMISLDGASEYLLAANSDSQDDPVNEAAALSFSGGAELADTHFVMLMFPDGELLSAQGSYSGVQARGALSKARKRAAAAAAAAARARKIAAQRARQQAARSLAQAEALRQQARAAAGQVVETVREAIPDAPFKDLLDAASELAVRELLACLADARKDRRSNNANIGDLAKQMAGNPSAALESIRSDVQTAVDARLGDFSNALDAAGSNPTPDQIVGASFMLMTAIGEDRPAFGCLLALIEPKILQIRQNIAQTHAAAQAKIQETINQKLLPAILGNVDEMIGNIALGNDTSSEVQSRGRAVQFGAIGAEMLVIRKWEREAMASGLYMQALVEQYTAASIRINAALNQPNPDRNEIREALAATMTLTDDTALRFGLGMIRYRGHRQIDTSDGKIQKAMRKILKTKKFGEKIAEKIVTSICGLIPEAGAGICNVILTPVEAISIFVVENTVSGIIEGLMHRSWDLGVNTLEDVIVNKRDAITAAGNGGPFFQMLMRLDKNDIAAAASRDLPDGYEHAITNYSTSLDLIVDRWELETGN